MRNTRIWCMERMSRGACRELSVNQGSQYVFLFEFRFTSVNVIDI